MMASMLSRRGLLRAAGLLVPACLAAVHASPLHGQAADMSTRLSVHGSLPQDTLHLAVGESFLLHGEVPMKRVYVGNPAVLSSFNSSPTDILITAKEPGVSSLVVWDTHDASRIYTIASDLDPSGLQLAVHRMYPDEAVHISSVGDRIQLDGTVSAPEISDSLAKLAGSYGKQVANSLRVVAVHPKQVELKLQIIEVDRTRLDQFGVNITSGGKVPASTSTNAFTNPLNLSVGYLKESIALNIQALAQKSILQILAEPTLTTVSGLPARFLSGGEFPVPVAQAGSTGAAAITIQFRPYGVKVDFLPAVTPDGTIHLKVQPEVSTLDYANAVVISGFTVPALSTRRAETEIELKDGQSFVLSGLLDHRTMESLGRVPGVARVPVLGQLFRSVNNTHSVTELVFVVTAHVVDPLHATPPALMIRPSPEVKPTLAEPLMTQPAFDHDTFPKQVAPPAYPN